MADNKDENEKKGGIVKIAIFAAAGLVLLGIGLGIGALIFGGGSEPDPSAEVSEILDGNKPTTENKKEEEEESSDEDSEVEMECTENADGEEECVPKKKVKKVNVEEKFLTTYYEFPGNFTTNLRGSKQFLQTTVGVSTQYDEEVMVNVESHQLALRSEILTIMSEFSSEDIAGKEGKNNLAESLRDGINEVLVKVEGFGGIENVHFTSFVVQ